MRHRSIAAVAALTFALPLGGCSIADLLHPNDAQAMAVIARTKTNRATYAIYNWYRLPGPGDGTHVDWAAEFNSGSHHRVETPFVRVVADCDAKTGEQVNLKTGERRSGPLVANQACGIDTNETITNAKSLGQVDTPYGKADRIRFDRGGASWTYDIDKDGVILRSWMTEGGKPLLTTVAVVLERQAPDGDAWSAASLEQSAVPEKYRTAAPPAR